MLIRCDVHDGFGLGEILRCRGIARFLAQRGHRIAWAVPKTGYEKVRDLLDADATIYRLPLREQDESERLARLHHKHRHQVILINRSQASSAYQFNLSRHFKQTILIDHGNTGMIYASMLINSDPDASSRNYNCHSATQLFLGPKYHLCDPAPVLPPSQDQLTHLLLDLGDRDQPALRILEILAQLENIPRVHVLCSARAHVAVAMRILEEKYPDLNAHPVLRDPKQVFPFENYPFIITSSDKHCLDLARRGQFFLTLAVEQSQVESAYLLAQKGVAPTLGWLAAKDDQAIAETINLYLEVPEQRRQYAEGAMAYVDGQGLVRMAHLIIKD